MKIEYPSITAAVTGILCEAVRIVSESQQSFVVIGGWSPYLLNSGRIVHPGTRDVDLLFERGATQGELELVVQSLLRNGYISSAKHHFQLLRVADVCGREFVFNLDLLHVTNLDDQSDMFVDHLVVDEGALMYRYQSIMVPLSSLLFEPDGHTRFEVTGIVPCGDSVTVDIPLMSELGTILTKSTSMSQRKRERDAFDVMLAICQARDIEWLADSIRQNCVSENLETLWKLVIDNKLRRNIEKYWSGAKDDDAWRGVEEKIVYFLHDSGVEA